MNDETARTLLAGFISGSAAAFATTFLILAVISRNPGWQQMPRDRKVPMSLVGVVFVNLMMLLWTAAGLVLGAIYLRAESERPAGALLTPNWTFTLGVTAFILVALVTVAIVRGRLGTTAPLVALIGHLAFAWMLPMLAR